MDGRPELGFGPRAAATRRNQWMDDVGVAAVKSNSKSASSGTVFLYLH